ncbi:MAG: glycosyltransferase 61 family protein [Ilumatobacteraceae bacterium]
MADGVVLLSSFHHPSVTRTRSRALTGSGQWFTGEPSWSQPPGRLDGPFFHLDSEFPGHFGHLLTEDVAKLWGWDEAKQRHPDLRVLRSSGDHGQFARWELELLGGYGIGEDEVVDLREPVIVDLLVTASQQFHNGKVRYAHGDLADGVGRLRDGIRSGTASSHERAFITRSAAKRSCRNRAAVEALFAARGFHVVHPETMALADQVELFAGATVVAGFGGSGMFGTIYSPPGTRIVLTSEEYKASNEYLIASVTGGDYHHFDCPIGAYDPGAPKADALFHRNFAFDFARDGPALDRVLDTLDRGRGRLPRLLRIMPPPDTETDAEIDAETTPWLERRRGARPHRCAEDRLDRDPAVDDRQPRHDGRAGRRVSRPRRFQSLRRGVDRARPVGDDDDKRAAVDDERWRHADAGGRRPAPRRRR